MERNNFLKIYLPLFFVIIFSFFLLGAKVDKFVKKIQKRYDKIENFVADFSQENYIKSMERRSHFYGKVYFSNDNKIRWDYLKPTKDQFISNGKKVWYYNEKERQVFVGRTSRFFGSNVAFLFLTGMKKIRDIFNIEEEKSSPLSKELLKLKLIPKKKDQRINFIIADVDKQTFLINRLEIHDNMDNLIIVKFSNIKLNVPLPNDLFVFQAPEGVEIIEFGLQRK